MPLELPPGLRSEPFTVAAALHAGLEAGYDGPAPTFDARWQALFG